MKGPERKEGSQPIYGIKEEKNVYAEMRDGVKLACDIYRPDAEGKFPALLGYCPYTKVKQSLKIPYKHFNPDYAGNEKGDTEYFVSRGYVHVIAEARGTGHSEGDGMFDIMATQEQEDGYDLVEWIARQPWCDGNVGMVGISYFAIIQYLVAAQQPPHLKAIFPHDGWGDMYRDISHHGGILMQGWLARFTQGGGIVSWNAEPASLKMYSEEELNRIIDKLKNNEVINKNNYFMVSLTFPKYKPTLFDWLVNELDGPYYWERSAYTKYDRIKIPVFLGSEMHAYPVIMHLPGAFSAFQGIDSPKRLVIRPSVPERPFHEFHDEIIAWYDYWLKGIDTGIMDEPPIKIWVRGAERWKYGHEWPLADTQWKKYYLRADSLLEESPADTDEALDSFNHVPVLPLMDARVPLDPMPKYLSYATEPLDRDMEVVGPIALYLYAAIDSEDADFIVKLKDVSPDGSEFVLTRGWLKASHRELDKEKSTPWQPYHPHTRAIPVIPGDINEYAIEVRPISNLFRKGHRIKLEIWSCDYPSDPVDRTLDWPGWSHLSYNKKTSYKIYHDRQYPSHFILPMIS
ncbi:MAG: CocE/NonD family hydrolase [Pseudomonadota bacterium]